ncbi:Zinc metalloprotease [Olavius sp. associated proteobacterium Delta 1]|nr:Zinc metalloprotease [Olavius sp. associated proteobacterium Delta 1]
MSGHLSPTSTKDELTRREFLWLSSMLAGGLVIGCATDPVTGKQQFMLMSEEEEIQIDKLYSPYQFSADYGTVQDKKLNGYIDQVGKKLAVRTHRPHMPYSFRVVNATYVNAYAFPGGSIAATRGILLKIDNEAELAGLLGHELGHVNARHAAEQQSKGNVMQLGVGLASIAAMTQSKAMGELTSQLGMIGAGALLSYYSRDNEREADALGMNYMVEADYGSDGFVGLMDMLNNLSKRKLSATELLFATHPMSDERYQTAVKEAQTTYISAQKKPLYRERYMDNIAKLRAQKGAIEQMQKGQESMMKKKYDTADDHFRKALKKSPDDYAGLVLMARSQLLQQKWAVGREYAEMAQKAYPQEAQAYYLSGIAKIKLKAFEGAYEEFNTCEKLLPSNPNTIFFKGYSQEKMEHIPEAAKEYQYYLQMVQKGDYAKHAYRRLKDWRAKGYIE